jgi:drug/metabolite transporter (DMT)-like permease
MLLFLKKSSLQWVGIYNLIGIAITTVYVWIFEELEISSVLLGGVFILLGFGWFLHANSTNSIQLNIRQHLLLSLMTIAFSSSSLIHWKNLTGNISPLVIISNQESIVLLTSFVLLLRKTNLSRIKTDIGQNFIPILSMSVVLLGAFSCSLLGLKITNPIISGMIFLTSPLTTILFSSYFFKETISKQNWLAISIISVGAFLLHLQTS